MVHFHVNEPLETMLRILRSVTVTIMLIGASGCGPQVNPNVVTQHNDNLRTGAYLAETSLTPDSVRTHGMHIKYCLAPLNDRNACPVPAASLVDGSLATQLLYMRGVFNNGTVNGLFVATSNNKVYGFDADRGTKQWKRDLMENDPQPCDVPRGVNSTPVIDPVNRRMYVLFSTTYAGGPNCPQTFTASSYYFLAALDVTNGNYAPGFATPVVAIKSSVKRDDGSTLDFQPQFQFDRTGLLLENGSIYVAFSANGGFEATPDYLYHGWVMRFSAANLALQGTFCSSPNATAESKRDFGSSGIWQGGGGLAADPNDMQSNVYFLSGNGPSGVPSNKAYAQPLRPSPPNSWGDSFIKLRPSGRSLTATAFVPDDAFLLDLTDADLGSGGAMLIPGSNLVIGGGKTGIMYVLDRGSMKWQGQFEASTNQYHQWMRGQTWDGGPHLHGSPTYWDSTYGYLYVWGEKDYLRSYRFDKNTKKFEQDSSNPPGIKLHRQGPILAIHDTMPGGMLSVSANGSKEHTGIVWATLPIARCPLGATCPDLRHPPQPPFASAIYAFDAEDLTLLWRDKVGNLAHWVPPTIADGKVFVPTDSGKIFVYDLCLQGMQCAGTSPFGVATSSCHDCHIFGHAVLTRAPPPPLHNLFANEASVWGSTAMAVRALAPPRGHQKNLILEGEGQLLYEGDLDLAAHGTLVWRLKGGSADLLEVKTPGAAGVNPPPLRVRLSGQFEWSASDGSTVHGVVQTTAPAPASANADWVLFKVIESSGQGVLGVQRFIQCIYTIGGSAPADPPKRRGEQIRVPYSAQYWLYR
jgi:hypothetical protein